VLRGVEGISFIYFDDRDVVRHSLVQRIVKAYERYETMVSGSQLALRLTEPAVEAAPISPEPLAGRRSESPEIPLV